MSAGTSPAIDSAAKPPATPGPAWDVARLFPDQGEWDESDYLLLTAETNRLVEFVDGRVEVIAMPTLTHQLVVAYLHAALVAFATPHRLGLAVFAALRVRLRPGLIREPDIVFMLAEHRDRAREDVWDGADLVMEVVSPDAESRRRDYVTKRTEYARAGIPEYWVIDPQAQRITVLTLAGKKYRVHGEFAPGRRAGSVLLPGFEVDVAAVFAAGQAPK